MPDAVRRHHISSAVVSVLPGRSLEIVAAIEAMAGAEVPVHEGGRIVVVLEGSSTGELGARLTEIGALDGVITANMVFEQIEELEAVLP